ncbi:MAG: hypothetical protein H6589_06745 [Flavobacteriales bacterium]|nr:hypothetical protein [Flavobacteriales bacterium]
MVNDVKYPQFRKYKNNQSYFKIVSKTSFEEIKREGNLWKFYSFEAKILPDRNFIYDMTFDYENHWDIINESDFKEKMNFVI